jgi:hypothetical protein
MKKTVILMSVFLTAIQIVGFSQKKGERVVIKADTASADSLEYKVVVLDPGFETWLQSKPPLNYYSKSYYEVRNRWYVSEWNLRYQSIQNRGLYDSYLDYNPRTDYGLEFNYRLYYFFLYFEETNHIKLVSFGK